MSESYYPAHASLPLDELEIWDNAEGSALDAWRDWFKEAGAGWEGVECIECELGRSCLRTPPCEGAEVDNG